MRKLFGFICLILAIIPCASFAETDIKVSGQLRMKNILDDRSLYKGAGAYADNYLRTRVIIKAVVDSNAAAFIQLQDSRAFSGGYDDAASSGTEISIRNVDLHQAFFLVNRVLINNLSVAGGRFELTHGNQRILGPNDWDEVARAWNGAQVWCTFPLFTINIFGVAGPTFSVLQNSERTNVWGGRIYTKKPAVDLLLLYDNTDYDFTSDHGYWDKYTLAAYGRESVGRVSMEYNASYQWGAGANRRANELTSYSISAYLLAADLGWWVQGDSLNTISVGLDYSSGDPEPRLIRHEFDAPYRSQHNFNGFMGFFSNGERLGLADLYASVRVEPVRGWQIKSWLHNFTTEYSFTYSFVKGVPQTARDRAWELDLASVTTLIRGITIEGGFDLFYPSSKWINSYESKTGRWAYLLTTLDF